MNNNLTDLDWQKIRQSRKTRINISQQSFYWFFHLYFGHYIKFPTAQFQKEMITLASDPAVEQLIIMAFRESGKSTIMSTAFPLWAITGHLQKKYVVIVSQTQNQVQQHLANISRELEGNQLLRKDYWPVEYETNELGVTAINLPKFNARIIAVSREQGVRGLRFGEHRPDLIIADDVEDSKTVKTKEARNSNFAWFTGELLPLGSENTKYIIIGNLLHEDSLLMRLKESIEIGKRDGVFKQYPLEIDGQALWSERYPTSEVLGKLERKIADPIRFEREYRLNLVPDDTQIITRDMIHYYPELPVLLRNQSPHPVIGVDLAISERDTADYTSMITIDVRKTGGELRLYILPNPINERLNFGQTLDTLRNLNAIYKRPKIYVENVSFQDAVVQQLRGETVDVEGIRPTTDKRSRLNMISSLISNGTIIFPERGAEALIDQLVGFGVERHDDLVDALTLAVLEIMRKPPFDPGAYVFDCNIYGSRSKSRRNYKSSRDYWKARLDDFNEATSGEWD